MTAFPGIMVEELRVTRKGSTNTLSFDVPVSGESFDADRVRGFLEDNVTDLSGRDELKYTLLVKGSSRPTASAKARAFVRLKNPFEISVVDTNVRGTQEQGTLVNTYRIIVGVTK